MKNILSKIGRGIKKVVNERIAACREILTNPQNRLILGFIFLGSGIGIGAGLIASAYIRVPE